MTPKLLKVVLVGDGNVGKTLLVRQFCENRFVETRIMTIGVDFQTKLIELPQGTVKLSIWDVAGQDRFQVVRENFYRGANAVGFVYDLGNIQSLQNLVKWYKEVRAQLPVSKLIVVGNKADTVYRTEPYGPMFAKKINAGYQMTSAKTGLGVQDFFQKLAINALNFPAPRP